MDTDPKSNACVPGVWNAQRLREVHSACHIDSVLGCRENLTNQAVFLPLDGSRTNDSTAMFRSNTCNTNLLRLCLTRRRKLLIVVQKRSGERHCFPQCCKWLKHAPNVRLFQQLPSTSLTLPQIPILGAFNEAMPSNTAVLRAADPIARTSSCCFKRMLRHLHQLVNRHDA